MPFAATWMDLENIILSEVSQTEKDKYYMISLICRIRKIIQVNLFKKQKQTHRHRKLWSFKYQERHGSDSDDFLRETTEINIFCLSL